MAGSHVVSCYESIVVIPIVMQSKQARLRRTEMMFHILCVKSRQIMHYGALDFFNGTINSPVDETNSDVENFDVDIRLHYLV